MSRIESAKAAAAAEAAAREDEERTGALLLRLSPPPPPRRNSSSRRSQQEEEVEPPPSRRPSRGSRRSRDDEFLLGGGASFPPPDGGPKRYYGSTASSGSSHNRHWTGAGTQGGGGGVVRFDDDHDKDDVVPPLHRAGAGAGAAASSSSAHAFRNFAVGHEDDTATNSSSYNAYNDGSEGEDDDASYNHTDMDDDDDDEASSYRRFKYLPCLKIPSLRKLALLLSLNVNVIITVAKLVAYLQSKSLSVLAALLDSVLDILSQLVLNYTEKHSSLQRSSAHYPAGASRLEPIGVLTCAALMGMASFEVVKESLVSLVSRSSPLADDLTLASFYNMLAVIAAKLFLLYLCNVAARRKAVVRRDGNNSSSSRFGGECHDDDDEERQRLVPTKVGVVEATMGGAGAGDDRRRREGGDPDDNPATDDAASALTGTGAGIGAEYGGGAASATSTNRAVVHQLADPTLEAIAQDHFNDILSNGVAAVALLAALRDPTLWFLDPVGAIAISIYIIYSWYRTGKEQIEHLTGRTAPEDLIDELKELAENFDDRMQVDVVRAYHFGPKFLVEIEVVMPKTTLLFESHDVGMELQYEIESREEVERCFVHIDYQQRPYDEHVVSKVPELREKYRPKKQRSTVSL